MRLFSIRSSLLNGAETISFEKDFEVSSAPPLIGEEIAFACFSRRFEREEKGVVTDARVTGNTQRVEIEYSMPTADLRTYLKSAGWVEIPPLKG